MLNLHLKNILWVIVYCLKIPFKNQFTLFYFFGHACSMQKFQSHSSDNTESLTARTPGTPTHQFHSNYNAYLWFHPLSLLVFLSLIQCILITEILLLLHRFPLVMWWVFFYFTFLSDTSPFFLSEKKFLGSSRRGSVVNGSD